jgi:predicted TPR repeat methyltransferase
MFSDRMQDMIEQKMEPSEPVERELTLEEALIIAIQLQKNEQLAEAEAVYSRILKMAPNHGQALHYAGVLAYQQGRTTEAVVLIEKSLELIPDRPDYFNNLGIVLQGQGRLEDAITAYRHAIALDPGHANAHSNLGVMLRATGKPVEAEASYRTAISLNPGHIDAYTNLGILLSGLKRTQEAVVCFCKVITLRPKHPEARKLLALAHCALGEVDEAVKIFENQLAEEPGDPVATHMLAACTGRGVPPRASDAYVEGTFDSFAASFESKLARLSYRAPALVAGMLEDMGIVPAKSLVALDAGCGTGLCGPLIAPYVRRLTGIDLSAGMLTQAKEKNVYDELFKIELTAYMRDNKETFDLIVSADTLVYFGALDDAIDAASKALRPGGLLIFTVEYAGADADVDYRLELHGRYAHSRAYVERLLTAAGLAPEIAEAHLRMESGTPVAGLVVRATKRSGEGTTHA